MADLLEDDFLLLNALWLRKLADQVVLEENSGHSNVATRSILNSMIEAGNLRVLGDHYIITDEGRKAVIAHYDRSYGALREDPGFLEWYERFESYNGRFLELVSAWQTGSDDAKARAYSRLSRVVERHVEALSEAQHWMPRYGHYALRFQQSLDRVDSGYEDYVSSPTLDSLHNIWFEFHEDILAVLGRPRESAEV